MTQPVAYVKTTNFTTYANNNPAAPYNAADHDVEFDNLVTTIGEALANLALIQRDDTKLGNGTVHADAFDTGALALIASDTFTPKGLWLTATNYVIGDMVEEAGITYISTAIHTSGVFATDKSAGRWIAMGAAAVSVAGLLAAVNNLSDLDSAETARNNLGLGGLALLNAPVAIAKGGTGAITSSAALGALGGLANPMTAVLNTGGKAINESKGTSVASSGTTNIWATNGNTLHITGTDTITSFGTAPRAGAWRTVIFDDVLTLTDGGNLNLQGSADIATAANDFAFVYAETITLFRVVYFKADGTSIVAASSGFSTGMAMLTYAVVAESGWVLMDDGSIGNLASGGTTRANADTEALFKLLWDNTTDAECPVSSGRGGNAQADFDADKNLTIPLVLGRALAITGAGSGLTTRVHGDTLGEETHTMTTAELKAHNHAFNVTIEYGSGGSAGRAGKEIGGSNDSSISTLTLNNTGSTTPFNVVQPTTFLTVMIKL